jgi:leucine-rich repeat kinase 2
MYILCSNTYLLHNSSTVVCVCCSDSLVLLGSGAFGQVFRSSQGGRAVAIKRYSEHREEPPHRLLRQEAELLRQVQGHPSIVNVLSVSISPYCISMELAPCGSLQQHLASGAISHKRILLHRIALQITHGLTFIHERHIVYRDMKPDNVLIYSLSTSVAVRETNCICTRTYTIVNK